MEKDLSLLKVFGYAYLFKGKKMLFVWKVSSVEDIG